MGEAVEYNVSRISESNFLEHDGPLSDYEDRLDALFIKVPRALARFFFGVFTDEAHLSIFVFYEGSKLDEVEVAGHEYDCVALATVVNTVPDFLGEVAEPGGVGVLEAADVWEAAEGYFDALGL